mmetsp:Transcript_66947/g.160336  ORF Transcript_66947/g.160336 Transcript_66947/m.160336 type:complete len:94 (-) Transcript_66947:817-1098(-)
MSLSSAPPLLISVDGWTLELGRHHVVRTSSLKGGLCFPMEHPLELARPHRASRDRAAQGVDLPSQHHTHSQEYNLVLVLLRPQQALFCPLDQG